MKKSKSRPLPDFPDIVNRLQNLGEIEGTRGSLIVLGEMCNTALAELLLRFFRDSQSFDNLDKDSLLGINAPLGTFSSRIKAGVRLGLVSPACGELLNLIREIRNKAAHIHLDLRDPDEMAKIEALEEVVAVKGGAHFPEFFSKTDDEPSFMLVCSLVVGSLVLLREFVEPQPMHRAAA